jgi:glycerol-3-phosphate acyltransferase PlsY
MDEFWKVALALLYGYLLGSVSMAYLVGRLVKGVDLRHIGSGTLGASNVWYNVGKPWIFPVGIFDLLVKGATPALLARYGLELGIGAQAGASLLAVAGHNWPIFLGFKGGRGVTPMAGVLLVLAPIELGLFGAVAVVGWRLTKSAALWVLISTALLPLWSSLSYLFFHRPLAMIWLTAGLAAVMVVKRLAANSSLRGSTRWRNVLWNRLFHDRDIADHDAWVGGPTPPQHESER